MNNNSRPYLILTNQGQTLPPFELSQSKHILGRDPQFADLLVPSDWGVISRCQATLIVHNDGYMIYDGDGVTPSSNKLFIDHHLITHDGGYALQNGDVIKIGQNVDILITLKYVNAHSLNTVAKTPGLTAIPLQQRSVMIGRDDSANLQLPAPAVSRKHAVLDYLEADTYLLWDYSTNGVYVNGVKVNRKILINGSATIKIIPYTLVLQNNQLVIADSGDNIRLDARRIVRTVQDSHRQTITLLNQISLPIEPGQLVALVGGSGAGKSTLMKTLLGIEPTSAGAVYLNGEDLRSNFNWYRNQIGYVPQKDIVHKDLKVEEVLQYAARLRLPNDGDIDDIVERTLLQIEMQDRRSVLVKNLSGGQLKRVSIGVELLVDPKLFFLDEPTSGLDPGLDKKMMLLLRKLADQGRTIVLVTHATANINLCDRLVFLGQGGNLCFYGPFDDACQFFGLPNGDFADAYIQLDSQDAVLRTAQRFQSSPFHRQYVEQRLAMDAAPETSLKPSKAPTSLLRQTGVLAHRYGQILLRDRLNLGIALATAPLGILLINLAIASDEPFILGSDPDPSAGGLAQKVLLVFTCAAIWVGLASSLQEIVKENAIYNRERLVNLNIIAYITAKILILSALALLQTGVMTGVILICFHPPDPGAVPWIWGVMVTTFLTLFAAISLGLLVSTVTKNSTQANSALPILLLPQIIFSGVLFKVHGLSQYLSWLMMSRWSVGAYGALVDLNALIPEATILPDGTAMELPLTPSAVYAPELSNLLLNWQVLICQGLFCLTVIYGLKKQKDVL